MCQMAMCQMARIRPFKSRITGITKMSEQVTESTYKRVTLTINDIIAEDGRSIVLVVSTMVFSVHFSRFPAVEHECTKVVPVDKESSHSMGGTILFLALFAQNKFWATTQSEMIL